MCSFSFLFLDLFPMAARQSTFWQKQTASGSSSTSSPARSWTSGGSQFHWPEEDSGSLQPTTAHGPRFGPPPPSCRGEGPTDDGEGISVREPMAKGSGW